MGTSSSSSSSSGIGFLGLLQVAFIILKVTNLVKWSWFWVLAPTWAGILLALIVVAVVAIVIALKK